VRHRKDQDSAADDVVGPSEYLEAAAVRKLAAPVPEDEVAAERTFEHALGADSGPGFGETSPGAAHLDANHDPVDDDPGPRLQIHIRDRKQRGGAEAARPEQTGRSPGEESGLRPIHSKYPLSSS
jgi:hypothetical protein